MSGGSDTGEDTGDDTGGPTDSGEPVDTNDPGDTPGGSTDTAAPDLPRWSAAYKAGEKGGVSCSTAGAASGWLAIFFGVVLAARRRE